MEIYFGNLGIEYIVRMFSTGGVIIIYFSHYLSASYNLFLLNHAFSCMYLVTVYMSYTLYIAACIHYLATVAFFQPSTICPQLCNLYSLINSSYTYGIQLVPLSIIIPSYHLLIIHSLCLLSTTAYSWQSHSKVMVKP